MFSRKRERENRRWWCGKHAACACTVSVPSSLSFPPQETGTYDDDPLDAQNQINMSARRSSGPEDAVVDPFGSTQEIGPGATTLGGGVNEFDNTHVIGSSAGSPGPSRAPVAGGGNNNSRGGAGNGGGKQQQRGSASGTMKTRTVADLRAARESRANEALKMKDEQLRILQDQNNQLLRNLDRCVRV